MKRVLKSPIIVGILILVLVTLVSHLFKDYLELINIALLHLIPVLAVSINGNMKSSLTITFFSVVLFDLFYVPPIYSFTVHDIVYLWSFIIFFLVGYIISWQSKMLITKTKVIDERERRTRRLYELSYKIVAVSDLNLLAKVALPLIAKTLESEIALFLKIEDELKPHSIYLNDEVIFYSNDKKKFFINFKIKKIEIDKNINFSTINSKLYLPIYSHEKLQGVIGVNNTKEIESLEIQEFLIAILGILAVGIERITLEKENQKTKLLERSNEMREILLNTISHDLKTPLSSILGSVSLLLENSELNTQMKNTLLSDIENASKRMNRLISNLLDSARLEDKNAKLKMNWCDIEDILGVALHEFNEDEVNKYIKIKVQENLKLFWGDSVLLSRLIVNLLDNAIKYSLKKEIKVDVNETKEYLKIKVFNEGKAIKSDKLKSIFDKFYRLDSYGDISGSGIGLSICKSIVKAHEGEIKAYNVSNGVCFETLLPKIKKPLELKEEI